MRPSLTHSQRPRLVRVNLMGWRVALLIPARVAAMEVQSTRRKMLQLQVAYGGSIKLWQWWQMATQQMLAGV
jgi:hypothetical protein